MAGETQEHDPQVNPPGEAIHLPGPSYLPVLVAMFTTIALVGVVVNWVVFGIGIIGLVYVIIRWISQARAEMAELPLEHH